MIALGTLQLCGFALAHALNIVADLSAPELLVPFALCEDAAGGKTLTVFEADTQAEAVENGKRFMADPPSAATRCAFARDGIWRHSDGSGTDSLSVSVWQRGERAELVVSQPYTPPGGASLVLAGAPIIVEDGQVLDGAAAERPRTDVLSGVAAYPEGRALWRQWHGTPALPTPNSGAAI